MGIGEKVKHINNGVNKMLIMLADETEDIQTKAKPVIDAIIKVDELIQTPEVQAVAKALSPPEPCYWNYGREKYTKMGNSRNKYWVDDDWIRCLSRRGDGIQNIWYELRDRTGAPMQNIKDYTDEQLYQTL